PRWYVPLEGCNQLKDGEQPRANDVITRYPACTVQAVLGPCTRHGGPWASLALDADDEQGVDWVQRNLGGACTVWEKTPHGAHYYYIYRLSDAPNGEELPKCERLNIDGAGTVDLRTRGVCCTLAGSVSQKDGSIYGPWQNQWAFRALNRDALFWLAALAVRPAQAVRQKEAEVQPPTMAAAVGAPTTPHAVQVEGARTIDFAQYANTPPSGASMDRRAEAALPSIVDRACAAVAAAAEGTRNSTLAAQAFQVARAYRDLVQAHSLPDDVTAALLQASDACGLPRAEAVACVQHAERDVFQKGKGAPFRLEDRPYQRTERPARRRAYWGVWA
ncbi:hypothetical protein, partial [Bifidobacterium pseudocatenulatum]|uniref:hypothetical protein n=1 Tax=Bifidobacterium pseudocatenulatum TaxID=28026 RepID=UPI003DA2A6CC